MKNVILLTIDCLRADHLGCLGYEKEVSPNIDHLANKGVFFSQIYSNGPNTPTSFPSLLSSTYASQHPLNFRKTFTTSPAIPISEKTLLLPELLSREGYATAAFHSNPYLSSFFNYERGFDTFYDSMIKEQREMLRQKFKKIFNRDSATYKITNYIYELLGFLAGKHFYHQPAEKINKKGLSWLKQTSNKFFLWLHYMDPHTPLNPPNSSFIDRYTAFRLHRRHFKRKKFPPNQREKIVELYDNEISHLDEQIAIFLKRLRDLGISLDNTLLILTTDHGCNLGEHNSIPMEHNKLYDENLHVPLIILDPDLKFSGKIEKDGELLDLPPTILDLLGMEKIDQFLGESLLPLRRKQSRERKKEVISEFPRWNFSYKTKKWKLILRYKEEKQKELYNLQEDPKEIKNLIEEKKEKAKIFEDKIRQHIHEHSLFRRKEEKKRKKIKKRIKHLREHIQ